MFISRKKKEENFVKLTDGKFIIKFNAHIKFNFYPLNKPPKVEFNKSQ